MPIPRATTDQLASQARIEQRAAGHLRTHGDDTRVQALTAAADHLRTLRLQLDDDERHLVAEILTELATEVDIDHPSTPAVDAAVRLAWSVLAGDPS